MPTPDQSSLEYQCEKLLRAMMLADSRLGGKYDIKHHDQVGPSQTETVVLKAAAGDNQLEGAEASEVQVLATFGTATLNPAESDKIAAAMRESVLSPDLTVNWSIEADLSFCSIEPQVETERQDTDKLRKRIIKFSLLAKI